MSRPRQEQRSLQRPARYGPLAERFFLRAAAKRVPLSGGIELTHRCNLSCAHCYVNLPAEDARAAEREMSTAQIARVVDELADLGTMKLTFTGGEPLLRRDFAAIYLHARQKGLLVVVFTNGTLISPEIASLWQEHPPAMVEVTQYGADARTYNEIAGAGFDAYARFRAGLEQLQRGGIRFSLKSTAMVGNAHQIAELRAFAETLGVGFRFDTVISPRLDGGSQPLAQRLPPAEAARLDVELGNASREQWSAYCSRLGEEVGAPRRLYTCGAGNATFLIDPHGRLHVCELSRRPGWDVLAHGFARGWLEEIPRLLASEAPPDVACWGCAVEPICPNCEGMRALENKGVNRYLCRIADERNRLALGVGRPTPHRLCRGGAA